jgi:ankyrin repeat protein
MGHYYMLTIYLPYDLIVANLQSGQRGDTALITACYNGHSGIARVLLDQGATIDYKNQVRSI